MARCVLVAGAVVACVLTACEKKEAPKPAGAPSGAPATAPGAAPSLLDSAKEKVSGAVGTAAAALAEAKDKAVASTKSALDDLRPRIEAIKAKGKDATGESKAAFDRAGAELDGLFSDAQKRLDELRLASADKWQDAGTAAKDAVSKLTEAVRATAERLNAK
jgi:hypothetical protein